MRSNSFFPLCVSLVCLSLAVSAAGAAPAQQVEIAFELSRDGTAIAESVERLEHDGKTYRISAQMKGKGLLSLRGEATRTSRGSIGRDGLRPAEFEDQRSGRDTARALFDWPAKTLTLQSRGATETRPLPADAHDRLSYLYSFAFRAPGAAPLSFSITDAKGISSQVYQAAGRETLKTPAGEIETLKLVRRRNGPDDRSAEIWLASKRGFLPVRILVIEKDGTRTDQIATRITGH